jgi:hypothetical protein
MATAYTDLDSMPTGRKAIAILCIGLVVFAAFVPGVASALGSTILVACWLVIPAIAITLIRRAAFRCEEQPVSLLALLESRAPPATVALA